ncbi:oxidoreductase, aldo/keto reductase family [Treponema primitia ZAS-2]|uniref:Oxidoreductase, aldo/keto reductase family n=1 Tax=Treponema primitia (strain ATCC BAA-887 / DSM 12427 / ZAS-2) TaxID=545694 RepID=F5YNG0_TREPZ|nr:aldo/keto reductase [Treponema primitia]AEF84455.1 oxidoreductase, aldo/keto reductase family [Treponema primitia ZAS-2]
MKTMSIGNSGLTASVLTLGTWSIGGGDWWQNNDDEASIKTIHRALELGINLIDTAPIYGLGHSEEVVGKALAGGKRDKALIATKGTFQWDTEVGRYVYDVDGHRVFVDHSYGTIIKDCEDSLKRLGTDYIDIYYLHNPARDTVKYPVADTVRALQDLKKQGKIRAIGLSNVQVEHIESHIAAGCELDIVQRRYSLLESDVEKDILPLCEKHGLSLHAYTPLERGILTGTVKADQVPPKGDARDGQFWWKSENLPDAVEFVRNLGDLCEKNHCSPMELAIAYLRSKPLVNVICGARRPAQIEVDVPAAELVLAPEDVAEIRRRVGVLKAKHPV